MSEQILIQNTTIYLENTVLENGHVLLVDGKIAQVSKEPIATNKSANVTIINGKGFNLIPGFIDTHIHGANGADAMDGTEEAMDAISEVLPKEGTTSFLATTMTQSSENIEKALKNIADYENKVGHAEVIGVHLEGPFINIEKKGAQPGKYIVKPDVEVFKKWQEIAGGLIKTVTVAPELDEDGSFIKYLAANKVNVSAGHMTANFEEVKRAVSLGVHQLTHICNAMTGIHHRDIGAVGAPFVIDTLYAELIADTIHVVPEMMQMIYNNVGSEQLILITDAMRAKCLPDGMYELGGQPVGVKDNRATLEDGTLAGSILKMIDAAKNMLALDSVIIENIVEMASINPAKQIHVFDRKGSIAEGKDADVLLVDNELNIKYTICNGKIAFEER